MGKKLGKSESVWLSEMLDLNDKQLAKKLRDAKVAGRMGDAMLAATGKRGVPERTIDVKQIRKDEKIARRASQGERGLGALFAGLRGGGTKNRNHENIPLKDRRHPSQLGGGTPGAKNYQNIPLKDRVHPAEYQRILHREAKRQGLI